MITIVKWRSHAVLGNLELDFTKPDGTPYNTIVLAGENGTGKTSILETLSTFLNLGSFEPFDSIFYEVNGAPFSCEYSDDVNNVSFGFHARKNLAKNIRKEIYTNKNNDFNSIKNDTEDIRHYGCAYTKARSGFSTKKVTYTTTSQLDSEPYSDDATDDYTSIKQLLINLRAQDTEEWTQITESGSEMTYAEFSSRSKLQRFRLAFNNFFDGLTFDSIDMADNDGIKILFKKHGFVIEIDNLSTSEKQIVFRGAYLLKNIRSLDGGIVLIDEPELSMHPKWQKKILEFYRNLFTAGGNQAVQMIIATHSEYVVRSALEDSGNVLVIALEDDNGVVKDRRIQKGNMLLPTITAAETNYIAFGIPSIDYHTELYGYLQYKSNTINSISDCDSHIKNSPQYNQAIHYKLYTVQRNGRALNYETLPTYIRNCIDHPDAQHSYSDNEMETSIKLLMELCK